MSLKFGTSGLRGLVTDLLGEPSYRYALAFLRVMAERDAPPRVLIGRDLRASSPEIAGLVAAAAREAGFEPIDAGAVPTPALALEAARLGTPAVMVTGSHIPEDRNGLKFYGLKGEITKADEADILAAFEGIGEVAPSRLAPPEALTPSDARARYLWRAVEAFGTEALRGARIGIYQHSSVARDLLAEAVEALGGEAVPFGRAESFIPVDTEAHRPEDLAILKDAARGGFDAILSTDGDADRPLMADERGEVIRGDVLGLIAAAHLGFDTIVTPVTSGSALEGSGLVERVLRTRVGSPYVIAGIEEALAEGRRGVAGFEANGGFIQGTDASVDGRRVPALPTRDALLPLLCALVASRKAGLPLSELVARVGAKPAASHRLQNVPAEKSGAFLQRLAEDESFRTGFFDGLGTPGAVNRLDGVHVALSGGETVHFRASGNAPELRCYAEAASVEAAQALVAEGLERAARAL
ncbi:phosphomannomutase [Aureimonas ureilytica]|uniref:phosphomannomutase n=1 Tax=Aureimonas ureilytica TaxID=401562 RepID=UPI0003805391|nr:phosphomannomutase [Aureimonas ureilytica]